MSSLDTRLQQLERAFGLTTGPQTPRERLRAVLPGSAFMEMSYALLLDVRHDTFSRVAQFPACLRTDPLYISGKLYRALSELCEASLPYTDEDQERAAAPATRFSDSSREERHHWLEATLQRHAPELFTRYQAHINAGLASPLPPIDSSRG